MNFKRKNKLNIVVCDIKKLQRVLHAKHKNLNHPVNFKCCKALTFETLSQGLT